MIDWLTVVAHGFWIAGLALILAAFSYYYWLAGQEGRSLRQELAGPTFQKPLLAGLLLVGIGVSGTSQQLWQVIAAGAVAVGAAIALVFLWHTATE